MIYLDDRLLSHPKLLRAGSLIGRNGVSRAFTLYVAGIGYARTYLTNGKVSPEFVESFSVDSDPKRVANALADRSVLLWHREGDGYRIHDFTDWNDSAEKVKQQREKTRLRVARWRANQVAGNGGA